jgi:hypothetical protein
MHKPAARMSPLISFYYDSIGEAYADILGSAVISLQRYQFNEDLLFGDNTNITLIGGFDCDYAGNTGKFSILNGSLNASQGTVTLANLIIK